MDTDRLRAILVRLREQTEQEQGALSKASGDAAKTPLYSDSLIAAREWVGLRQGRPVMRITHNREAAASSGIDALHENGRSGLNLSGINQMVALFDNGHPRLTHVELSGRIERRDAFSTESSHSTHVAGTIAASGQWRDAMGMAPQARIRSHDWTNDVVEMAEVALEGIRVSNHSYGDPLGWTPNILGDGYWGWMGIPSVSEREDVSFGRYGQTAAIWDEIADAAAHLVIVKSAGNERAAQGPPDGAPHYVFDGGWQLQTTVRDADGGATGYDTIGDAGVAKNVITVGATADAPWEIEGPANVVMTSFSGWGPVDDGRIKPDLVANGTALMSSKAGDDAAYGASSGTSQAAPVVTGAVLLIQELWEQLFPGSVPLASTIKALLIHSADEAGTHPGPDYRFGWGHLNAERAAEHLKQAADADRAAGPVRPYPAWVFEGAVGGGEVAEFEVALAEASPMSATLVWTDPAGPVVEPLLDDPATALVHDLDLSVAQSGQVHLPWRLDPANPTMPATKGINVRDNVEQVAFEARAGTLRIRVAAPETLVGSEQRFSLVVGMPVDRPDASSTSYVSGIVRTGGMPVSGINVRLSGPVERGSRTGEDGVFLIDDVPAGRYTLRADPSLFEMEPVEIQLPEQAGRIDLQARARTQLTGVRIFTSSRLLQSGEQGYAEDISSVPAGGLVGIELFFAPHPGVDLSGSALVLDTDYDARVVPWSGVQANTLAALSTAQKLVQDPDGRLRFRIPILWFDGDAEEGSRVRIPFEVRHGSQTGALALADTLDVTISGRDTTGPFALISVRKEGLSYADVGNDMEIKAAFVDGSGIRRARAHLVNRFDTTRVLASMPLRDSGDLTGDLDFVEGDGIYSARFYPRVSAEYQLRIESEDGAGNISDQLVPAFYSSASFRAGGSMLLLAEDEGTSKTNEHLRLLNRFGEDPSWWERFVRGPLPQTQAGTFPRIWMARLGRALQRSDDVAMARRHLERGGSLHLFSRLPVQGEEAEAWLRDWAGMEVGPALSTDTVRGAGLLEGLVLSHSGPAPRTLKVSSTAEPLLVADGHVLAARSGNVVVSTVGVGSLTDTLTSALLVSAFLYEEKGTLQGIPRPGTIRSRLESPTRVQGDSITLSWDALPWARYEVQVSSDSLFESGIETVTTTDNRVRVGPLVRGVRYHWRVRGMNPVGVGPWNAAQVLLTRDVNRSPVAFETSLEWTTGTGKGRTYFSYRSFFEDPDQDILRYSIAVSDTNIVSIDTLVSGFYVWPENAGTASIALTATDPDGLSVETLLIVEVLANGVPRFVSWPTNPQYLLPETEHAWPISDLIEEPDQDSLRFWLYNEHPGVAEARMDAREGLRISTRATGRTYVALQASDGRGGRIDTSLVVIVRTNTAPIRNPLENLPQYLPGDSVALHLPTFISDPEDDPLSFELVEISDAFERVILRNDSLFARLGLDGSPRLTIEATDVFGASGRIDVRLTLNAAAALRTDDERIPERFEVLPTYPQPFSDRVAFPFSLPAPSRVRLDVYDSLGRHVARIVDRSVVAGSHRLDWIPPSGLPAGNYYYVLQADQNVSRGIVVFVP